MISQERLKIEVKLLIGVLIGSHICHVDCTTTDDLE